RRRLQLNRSAPAWKAKRSRIQASLAMFDTGDRSREEPRKERVNIEWRTVRQSARDRHAEDFRIILPPPWGEGREGRISGLADQGPELDGEHWTRVDRPPRVLH